ncbi:hypothetical protein SAMN05216474_0334 [Lishizhenia tianjinensis]|uniref:Uncharacterized protein n=1 Tax=Lishizhenia tianjinensis TaxID=477690 RepID=A0A1I6XNS4_9FLAO|nr:hypothetical protein [Lishizhenia tianjinensis]SFT39773.1 hypothetical protein SAMN05216474_0334 [Lishizhenia tianjinensis]
MKPLLLFLFVTFYNLLLSQGNYLYVETITEDEDFAFPLVLAKDSLVELKINTYLQLAELELLKGHEKEHIFERVN